MTSRYRCTACGNLTRFDVVATRRTRAFWHYTVGGELPVEEEQVLDATIEAEEIPLPSGEGEVSPPQAG